MAKLWDDLFTGGGVGGPPTPSALTPYTAGGDASTGTLRPKNGRGYGTLGSLQPLTTVLDVTVRSTFSYIFITSYQNDSTVTNQIRVSVNGNVIHDVTSTLSSGSGGIIVLLGDAFYAALSTAFSVTDIDGGASFNGPQMVADSLKIELSSGSNSTIEIRSDLELIA